MSLPDGEPLADRARRAVVGLPRKTPTVEEMIRLRHDLREYPGGGRRPQDYFENALISAGARLAAERQQARVRAALDALGEELAAALSTVEVARLLDIACEAAS